MPLIGQKFGFQFYFLISSLRSHLNSISFNHAAEGQHEHIILVISFYIEYTNSLLFLLNLPHLRRFLQIWLFLLIRC